MQDEHQWHFKVFLLIAPQQLLLFTFTSLSSLLSCYSFIRVFIQKDEHLTIVDRRDEKNRVHPFNQSEKSQSKSKSKMSESESKIVKLTLSSFENNIF